jgi:hypothetical protein
MDSGRQLQRISTSMPHMPSIKDVFQQLRARAQGSLAPAAEEQQ